MLPVPDQQVGICISGDYSGEVTPVPIPNTAVKLFSAEDTWRVTAWKIRSLPVFWKQSTQVLCFFCGWRYPYKKRDGEARKIRVRERIYQGGKWGIDCSIIVFLVQTFTAYGIIFLCETDASHSDLCKERDNHVGTEDHILYTALLPAGIYLLFAFLRAYGYCS